jgi:hypothetical protein
VVIGMAEVIRDNADGSNGDSQCAPNILLGWNVTAYEAAIASRSIPMGAIKTAGGLR